MGKDLEFRYRPMRVCSRMTTSGVIDLKALSLRLRTLCALKKGVNSQTHEKSVLWAEKLDILLRDVTLCRNNRKILGCFTSVLDQDGADIWRCAALYRAAPYHSACPVP